jgi:uncharacterized metal-binding protein (TIGR02443 family)
MARKAATIQEWIVACPACECMRSRMVHREGIVRLRECEQCGHRYRTRETISHDG